MKTVGQAIEILGSVLLGLTLMSIFWCFLVDWFATSFSRPHESIKLHVTAGRFAADRDKAA